MKKLIIEFIGTFFLTLLVALALAQSAVQGAWAVGFGLMALIYMGGHISSAHYNPAVTLAFFCLRRISWPEALAYVGIQGLASMAAVFMGRYLQPLTEAAVTPGSTPLRLGPALAAEFFFTFALALVILNVAVAKAHQHRSHYGLAIASIVLAGALVVGPISGAWFNPAVLLAGVVLKFAPSSVMLPYCAAHGLAAMMAAFVFKKTTSKNDWVEMN
jgi:aquaporin Z